MKQTRLLIRAIKDDARHFAERNGTPLSFKSFLYLLILSPGFQFVTAYRVVKLLGRIPFFGSPLSRIAWTVKCNLFRSEISLEAVIGGGLYIPHPYSVVVGKSRIGNRVTILQNVTIGTSSRSEISAPIIGDHVFIGAGAAVLGKVKIGDGATIGANSVVLSDVPQNAIAVGAPARARTA